MATQTRLVTYDDYLTLPDDGKRYEIINGELLTISTPPIIHQRISGNLLVSLSSYIQKNKVGEIFLGPVDVIFSMTDVVQPDLVFVSKEREQIITKKNIVEAPDLVVEILSENTEVIDRNRKKDLYQKFSVKEYWIVDPNAKQIEQYILNGDIFELNAKLVVSEELTSKVMDGFTLRLKQVFAS